jgi:hypothetical protein
MDSTQLTMTPAIDWSGTVMENLKIRKFSRLL